MSALQSSHWIFIQEPQIFRGFPVRGFFLIFDLWFEILDAFFNLVHRSDFFLYIRGKVFLFHLLRSPRLVSEIDRNTFFLCFKSRVSAANRDSSPFYDCYLSILLQTRWLQSTNALKRSRCPYDYSSLKTVPVNFVWAFASQASLTSWSARTSSHEAASRSSWNNVGL